MIPAPQSSWVDNDKILGRNVAVYDRLDSTNTLALALAQDPSQHGFVVLAREQTAGRGQYGRSWHAPPSSSVLMSLLVFPPPSLRRPALLTAWAAVSVCEAVLKLANLQARIKWPNDVLIQDKKVCGILIEQRTTGHADVPLATVVGIGLNISQSAPMFNDSGLPDACSLEMMAGQSFGYEEVVEKLLAQLDVDYAALVAGDFARLEALWKRRLGLLGTVVVIEGVHGHLRGRLLDVTLASLDLDVNGALVQLTPESVKHLHADMP